MTPVPQFPENEENRAGDEISFMDAKRLRFYKTDGGELRLDVENDRCVLSVTAVRSFPLNDPNHYISIIDANGDEVGMLYDLRQLDHESRHEVEEDLRRRYFTPKIEKIVSIRVEFSNVYCEVETDKGPKEFVVHGVRSNVVEISPGRYLIQDVDANRFEIPDLSQLDTRSRLLLERLV